MNGFRVSNPKQTVKQKIQVFGYPLLYQVVCSSFSLSEFIKEEQWIVREVEPAIIETPPPPKTKLEQKLENNLDNPPPQTYQNEIPAKVEALSAI